MANERLGTAQSNRLVTPAMMKNVMHRLPKGRRGDSFRNMMRSVTPAMLEQAQNPNNLANLNKELEQLAKQANQVFSQGGGLLNIRT